ncbi:MAG: hypothetical protein OXFUSZZB_001261, partial [Candidatus Fervidibacter sp.]
RRLGGDGVAAGGQRGASTSEFVAHLSAKKK